ncbi:hypothetical protein [Streptomyces endophyticus]|uniref:Type A2 lantipeptide n=1 Tax=Streptomyces endophyticus TaxID=714166 RepID=A0ABU6F6C4_9ACTN|nr:hypothetical protein [Streptomyces endophyticus]MEB8339554.1 hypothetical protein [Streptomyces endophyticus]
MNSAHQLQTLAISDADLDSVSGGLSPEGSVTIDGKTVGTADLMALAQGTALGAATQAQGALAQPHQVSINGSL